MDRVPPRAKPTALTAEDLMRLHAALAEGKRPTVYLRDAVPSLGVDVASSARVVSVEGQTVTVRPSGVDDDVPFESGELYASRRAAASAAAAASAPPTRRRAAPVPRDTAAPVPRDTAPPVPREPAAPAPRKAAPRTSARKAAGSPPLRVTVTLSGSADGGWTVHCAQGSTPELPGATAVPADAVSRAVAALGDQRVSEAFADVLAYARRSAARRVAELSAELERAQLALDALSRKHPE